MMLLILMLNFVKQFPFILSIKLNSPPTRLQMRSNYCISEFGISNTKYISAAVIEIKEYILSKPSCGYQLEPFKRWNVHDSLNTIINEFTVESCDKMSVHLRIFFKSMSVLDNLGPHIECYCPSDTCRSFPFKIQSNIGEVFFCDDKHVVETLKYDTFINCWDESDELSCQHFKCDINQTNMDIDMTKLGMYKIDPKHFPPLKERILLVILIFVITMVIIPCCKHLINIYCSDRHAGQYIDGTSRLESPFLDTVPNVQGQVSSQTMRGSSVNNDRRCTYQCLPNPQQNQHEQQMHQFSRNQFTQLGLDQTPFALRETVIEDTLPPYPPPSYEDVISKYTTV